MKNVDVLLYANGENRGTYGIKAIYNESEHKQLLQNKVYRFISYDFDQKVEVNEYRKISITVPDWFENYEITDSRKLISLKWLVGLGFVPTWDRQWFDKLRSISTKQAYYVIKLIKSNPRSEFRKSLKEQALNWLNEHNPKYGSPFSFKQWEYVSNGYLERDYKSIDRYLYRSKEYQLCYD